MIKGIIFDWGRTLYDNDKKELMDGAIFVLKELKNKKYKLCLVTRGVHQEKENAIKKTNVVQYFEEIFFVHEKVENDFVKCLNAMNLKHDEVMVVGDKVRNEVKVGNVLGMTTVWFRNGKYKDEVPEHDLEKPKHTILNLRDVLKLI